MYMYLILIWVKSADVLRDMLLFVLTKCLQISLLLEFYENLKQLIFIPQQFLMHLIMYRF